MPSNARERGGDHLLRGLPVASSILKRSWDEESQGRPYPDCFPTPETKEMR